MRRFVIIIGCTVGFALLGNLIGWEIVAPANHERRAESRLRLAETDGVPIIAGAIIGGVIGSIVGVAAYRP